MANLLPVLFENVIEEQVRSTVIAAMGTLIVETPIVGQIFDFVFSADGKVAHRLRRVAAQNFRGTAGFIEILLEPFEDAGNLDALFVRQKSVEIFTRQPGAICAVVLFLEFVGRVSRTLQRRATPRRADQNRVRTIADQWPQRPVLDIVERDLAATNFVALT